MNVADQIAAFLGSMQDGLRADQRVTAARIQFTGASDAEIAEGVAMAQAASKARAAEAEAHLLDLTALAANLHEEPWGQ